MTLASTPGSTWPACVSAAHTSPWLPAAVDCSPLAGATWKVSWPPARATCPPPTPGRCVPPWRCPAAATPAPLCPPETSWWPVATSTAPTPALWRATTWRPTPGPRSLPWRRPAAGTAPPPLEGRCTWWEEASWGPVESGWMCCQWRSTLLRVDHGAGPPRCLLVWALQVCPRWQKSCTCWAAGMKRRNATRRPCRNTTRPQTAGLWPRIFPSPRLESPVAPWRSRIAKHRAGSTATPRATKTSSRSPRTEVERAACLHHRAPPHRNTEEERDQRRAEGVNLRTTSGSCLMSFLKSLVNVTI